MQMACVTHWKNYNVAAIEASLGIEDEKVDADCSTGVERLCPNQ